MKENGVLFVTFNGFKVSTGYFAICFITALIAFTMILLNGVVLHAMVCHTRIKTISDYFLSCLAISDLVTGFMLLYITSYSILQYQIFAECLVRFGQANGIFTSSTLHLTFFTVDRFIKIILPLHYYKIFTKTVVVVISSLIWMVSLLIGFLPLFGWRNMIYMDNGHLECRYFGVLTDGYLVLIACLITSAALIMTLMYAVIFYVARKQANSIAAQLHGLSTSKSYLDNHSLKLAKTISIVVGISNICWLPTCKYFSIYS